MGPPPTGSAQLAATGATVLWTSARRRPEEADLALLGFAERERATRSGSRASGAYAAAHALVRRAVAMHLGLDPGAITLATRRGGQPAVVVPAADGGALAAMPEISLTHCPSAAACAVAPAGSRVGVDVEHCARTVAEPLRLARRFAAPERAALARLPGGARQQRLLLALWTLKEALGKALGLGLRLPLDASTFQLAHGRIAATLRLGGEDVALTDWRFALRARPAGHVLAVAYCAPGAGPCPAPMPARGHG